MKKLHFIFFVVTAVIFILFDLYKASHASFTYDECWTYLDFVNADVMKIISYHEPCTNNHILNTLSMKLSEALFGTSELTLRLPNILAHILYLIFTFKLIDRYCNAVFIPFFILINFNPFLLDFFSLARGYGMAIGLMSTGFYFYCKYLENRKWQNHFIALVFICFASLANFALLNIFLILILLHNLFQFFIYHRSFSLKNLWQTNKINIAAIIPFSIILYEPLRKIFMYKLASFGGVDGFWHDTVQSLLSSSAYYAPYEKNIKLFWQILIIAFSILFVFSLVKYFFKKSPPNVTQQLVIFFGGIIFFIVVGTISQNLLFGTTFLELRFALFIYPLFIFACSFLAADLWNGSYKFFIRSFSFLISVLFFVHTCYSLNTRWYYEWQYDMNTKNMLKDFYQAKPAQDQKISLGITWLFERSVNFYKKILHLSWLGEVRMDGLKFENEYHYLTPDDLKDYSRNEIEVINCYPTTGNCLIRYITNIKSRKQICLKAANGKYVCAEFNNLLIANRDSARGWETFLLLAFEKNKCAISAYNHKLLSAEIGHENEITFTRDKIAAWETFTITELENHFIAINAFNGKYISVDESRNTAGQLFAASDSIGEREKFEMILK